MLQISSKYINQTVPLTGELQKPHLFSFSLFAYICFCLRILALGATPCFSAVKTMELRINDTILWNNNAVRNRMKFQFQLIWCLLADFGSAAVARRWLGAIQYTLFASLSSASSMFASRGAAGSAAPAQPWQECLQQVQHRSASCSSSTHGRSASRSWTSDVVPVHAATGRLLPLPPHATSLHGPLETSCSWWRWACGSTLNPFTT